MAFGSVLLKHLRGQKFRWIFSLTLALLLSAVVIRTVLNYAGSSRFPWIMGLLAVWLILVITETGVTRRASWYIFLYLAVQTVLVGILLLMPGFSDFFATLTIILSMQAFRRLEPAAGSFFIALWAVLIMFALFGFYRYEAIALAVLYSAAGILFGAYTVATLRSEEARKNNESLAGQIDEANNRLRAYSRDLEQLSLTRERSRLAREMHDSITQTVFSMSLAVQSAGLMLKSNAGGVETQLQRIGQLSQSALSEMKLLISELHPSIVPGGLASALRNLITEQQLPGNLEVALAVSGEEKLSEAEEEALYYIIREALNNISKHARTGKARISLELTEAPRVEVSDAGRGFDAGQAGSGQGMGLKTMAERAAEIRWQLKVSSGRNKGTLVVLEKCQPEGDSNG